MDVVFIGRNVRFKFFRAVFAFAKGWAVEEDVVMAGVGFFNTGGGDPHAFEPKDDFHRAFDHIAVFQIYKIGFGIPRRFALFGFKREGDAQEADEGEGEELFHGLAFLLPSNFDFIYTLIVLGLIDLCGFQMFFSLVD